MPLWEFDQRYRRPRERARDEAVAAEARQAARAQRARMQADHAQRGHASPRALVYFEEVVVGDRRLAELRATAAAKVAVLCNFAPEELVQAAGAVPVRVCAGFPGSIAAAEQVLPRDICPLVKSTFGLLTSGVEPVSLCDAAVVPLSCDPKTKLAQVLTDYLPTWVIDLPGRRDYVRDMPVWLSEIREFSRWLEKVTRKSIGRRQLRDSIMLFRRRTEAFRALCNLRLRYPHLLSGRESFLVTQASFTDDVARWTEEVWRLVAELQEEGARRPEPPAGFLPVLLTGAPVAWPNWKVLNVIEEAGAWVVADTLCSGTHRLFDPVQVDEWTTTGMLRALALRYFSAPICPCFVQSADRMDRIIELARDFRVKGVISHNLRLCQPTDMETTLLRQVLKEEKIPLLVLQTDLGLEDVEQLKTRVEAFLEMTVEAPGESPAGEEKGDGGTGRVPR
jgi:benzoyl-CoA reductase/2-hydroxyglutaryl-CoA dehydratase subunit BcrC/BadD/HgdB